MITGSPFSMVQWLAFHLKSHTLRCWCACRSDFYVWRVVARWKVLDLKRWKSHLFGMKRAAALARSHRNWIWSRWPPVHMWRQINDIRKQLLRVLRKRSPTVMSCNSCAAISCSSSSWIFCNAAVCCGVSKSRSIHWCFALFEEVHPCCHDSSGRYFENAEYELPFASVTSKHLSKTPQEHMTNTCYKE